jgi:hypothetical protein|nr:MAG TPA: hypothetical protein [Caudoviricetes sp.]
MIIKLRSALDRQVIEVPKDISFVELCNDEGKVMSVLVQNKLTGTLDMFDFRDVDTAKRYENFFKVEFLKDVRVLDPEKYSEERK